MRIIQVLILLMPLALLGQKNYAPLDAEWNYEGHELECQGNHINYIVEKETFIQGKDCSIIYAYTSTDLNPEFVKSQDSLIVWEENDKVYFLEDSTFYLLFNFDPALGDTIDYYEPINKSVFSSNYVADPSLGPNRYGMVITKIELINVSGINLKKFDTEMIFPMDFGCGDSNSIIEYIGSTSQNLTGDQVCYVADGCFGGLQCYQNGVIDYKTDSHFETFNPSCDLLDATQEPNESGPIAVFPNPTSNELNIKADNSIDCIEIFTSGGQLVKQFRDTNRLQLEDLTPGFYLLKITSKEVAQVIKLVKK